MLVSILSGFEGGWGMVLEPFGASWTFFWPYFLLLVSRMVSKGALGGLWAQFWFDFGSILRGLGRVLGGFWSQVGVMLAPSQALKTQAYF